MITPIQSQTTGLLVSLGIAIGIMALYTLYSYITTFWQLGVLVSFIMGSILGVYVFERGQRNLYDLNMIGVGTTLGKPNAKRYTTGKQWVFWILYDIIEIPNPLAVYPVDMPGEVMVAQDRGNVLVGIGNMGEPCSIVCSIYDEMLFIRNTEWESVMRKAYLSSVRRFANNAHSAIGLINEQGIITEFLMLPPLPGKRSTLLEVAQAQSEYSEFETRLRTLSTVPMNGSTENLQRLYSEQAVNSIMKRAGIFRAEMIEAGIKVQNALMPNLRLAPEEEAAAIRKAVAAEDAQAIAHIVSRISMLTEDYQTRNPQVASSVGALIVAKAAGHENIDIEHKTYDVPGVPHAIASIAESLLKRS